MAGQMIIRIDAKTKSKLNQLAKSEGKTSSQIVRELIGEYIQERDIGAYIDDLWDRIGNKLRERGVVEADIQRAIKELRLTKE
ncbi:CopG family transcriptional regulator [candidate division KSB1 bacterium 4484_188]|nr:MAG: CopG family transcriptional regulator [candidate division KSB1 bacterium 4484_188]